MKAFFVVYFLNEEKKAAVIQAEKSSDVLVRLFNLYKDREEIILMVDHIQRLEEPFFFSLPANYEIGS